MINAILPLTAPVSVPTPDGRESLLDVPLPVDGSGSTDDVGIDRYRWRVPDDR